MIQPTAKRLAAAMVAALLLTLGIGYVAVHGSIKAAEGLCDATSLKTFARQESDPSVKTYLEQEAQACEGKSVTLSGDDSSVDEASTASSVSSSSPATTASATSTEASSSSSTTTTKAPTSSTTQSSTMSASKTVSSTPTPQLADTQDKGYVFYAWYSNKAGPNNFGPQVAMDPALHGMPMQSMNTAQAKQELKFRYDRDPMLTASTGCGLKLWNCSPSTLQSKTQLFMKDASAWNSAKAALDRKVNGQTSAVKTLPAGNYVSTYALSGGAYPQVFSDSIYRDTNMEALVFADGTTLRLVCGFQVYWAPQASKPAPVKVAPKKVVPIAPAPAPAERPKPLPQPSKGLTRTPEGVPEKLISVCYWKTGKTIQVPASKVHNYPNTGKCVPTSTPTSTPPPATSTTPPPAMSTPPPATSTTPPPAMSTPPPATSTTTPPSTTTTPPPATSTTLPPKCPQGTTDPACSSLPPGSAGKPTDNAPTLEPSPTHTGPTYAPSSEPSKPAPSSSSAPSPTTSRTIPSNEAPVPSETATGGPTNSCAVCG